MYLSKLEIQGFKSFAKKTVFEFPEKSNSDANAKSITAVVGPNGSGKSNVSDAIRWVLGEQSLKLIRCKKADDVIFGGSNTMARQGFAEISIYFNNEDKQLPIDYTEVVITRRVFRDGETEYLINKKKVRLYDILILLAKANFGQKSYSIIGQGMVDHVINISAFERKEFFDEATGVKQFQIKRDQSVNRLKRSRENLLQTNQILQELEPRLRLLTRQIKKLEKRKEIETSLKELQNNYYAYSWQRLQKQLFESQEQFKIEDELKKDAEINLNQIQLDLAELARQESRKDVFNNLQKDYNKDLSEKNELLKDLSVLKGKMSLEYTKAGKQNLAWMEDKKEELAKRIGEVKESLNNLEVKLTYKKEKLIEADKDVVDNKDELIILQNNLQSAKDDLAFIRSGQKTNPVVESVKAVLRQKDYIKGIYGTVAELGKVEPRYEAALAVAVGNRRLAVVVKDDETAVKSIKFLKENKLAPVTFLALNKVKSFNFKKDDNLLAQNGAIAYAVDLVAFDEKFKKAFELVLGSTVVVDTAENAKNIGVGRERMVTVDGDIFEKTGFIRGGFQRGNVLIWQQINVDRNITSQEEKIREIALLENKLNDKLNKKDSFSLNLNELKIEIQVDETKQKGLLNDLEELVKEKNKIVREIEENQISPKDQDKYLQKISQEKVEMEALLEKIDQKIAHSRKKIDEFNLEEEKKKEQVFKLQRDMQEKQILLNDINNKVNEINITIARLETKKEELEKEVAQELGQNIDLSKILIEENINLDQLWFEISKFKSNLEQIGGIDPEIVDEHKEVSERYDFLHNQVVDLEKAINDLEKIVEELDVVINKQFKNSFNKINKAFEKYFQKIFNGGKAKLELVQKEKAEDKDEDLENTEKLVEEKSKLVNTGIDIMVAPPNKKISNIAILSGGERTMTALALICAIIESNPAPFIVMDEVDAALDEANSEKLADILQELSYNSQFVVITHNRVIMHVADVLYGVAMGDDGVSKTLSLSLKEAEAKVKE